MTTFQVDDMTCGHCVKTITQAVQAIDPIASVQTDLASHRVTIDGGTADAAALSAAIAEAGYTPVAVAAEAGVKAVGAGGCGGGCGCR